MSEHAVPETTCCDRQMREVSSAARTGHKGGVQRVSVYQCEICGRMGALGESCDPGWVSAKAQMFLELRREAFERGGLEPAPAAVAIFDIARRLVIFGCVSEAV